MYDYNYIFTNIALPFCILFMLYVDLEQPTPELRLPTGSPGLASIITRTTSPSVAKVEVTDTVTIIPLNFSSQKPPSSSENKLVSQSSLSGSQSRLTVKTLMEYEKKKKQAEKGKG